MMELFSFGLNRTDYIYQLGWVERSRDAASGLANAALNWFGRAKSQV